MGVDQISQFRPNFTISAKFYNPGIPGILGIPGVRAVFLGQYLRCFITFVKGGHSWRGWLFRRAGSDTRDSKVIYANLINCCKTFHLRAATVVAKTDVKMWKIDRWGCFCLENFENSTFYQRVLPEDSDGFYNKETNNLWESSGKG